MAAITVPELVKEVGIAEKELDVKCSKEHLLSVSSFLDWRQAAPYLRLSEREIDDIEVERKSEQEKRRKTLEMWSGKHGFKATYRKLVDALLASSKADDAEKVCRLLVKGPTPKASPTPPLPTPSTSSQRASQKTRGTLSRFFSSLLRRGQHQEHSDSSETIAQKPRPTVPDSPTNTASAPTSPPQESDGEPLGESIQSPMAEAKHPLQKSVLENHLDQETEPLGTGRKRRRVTFATDPPSTPGSFEGGTVRGESGMSAMVEEEVGVGEEDGTPDEGGSKRRKNAGPMETDKSLAYQMRSPVEAKNEMTIKSMFYRLVSHTRIRLEERLQQRKFEIGDFYSTVIGMLSPAGDCIPKSSDLLEIFTAITTNQLWDYWNYYLLESIIELYCSDDAEMMSKIEEYKENLSAFQATTKIIVWMQSHDHEVVNISDYEVEPLARTPARCDPQYYRKLRMKLHTRVTEHTLTYIECLWRSLASRCSLPDIPVLLDKICSGSITIFWLIPKSAVSALIEKGRQCTKFFQEHQIVWVEVDGVCIYPNEETNQVKDGQLQKASALAQEACTEQPPAKQAQLSSHQESKPEKPPAAAQMDQQEAAKEALEQDTRKAEQQAKALEQKVQVTTEQLSTLQVEKKDLLAALDQRDAQLHYERKEIEYLKQRVKQLQQKSEGHEKELSQQQIEEQKVQMMVEQLRTLQVERKDLLSALDHRQAQLHHECREREYLEQRVKQLQQRIEGQEKQEKEAAKEKEHSHHEVEKQPKGVKEQLQEIMKEKEPFQRKIEVEEQLQQPLKERKHSHPGIEELKQQLEDEQTQKPCPTVPDSPTNTASAPTSPPQESDRESLGIDRVRDFLSRLCPGDHLKYQFSSEYSKIDALVAEVHPQKEEVVLFEYSQENGVEKESLAFSGIEDAEVIHSYDCQSPAEAVERAEQLLRGEVKHSFPNSDDFVRWAKTGIDRVRDLLSCLCPGDHLKYQLSSDVDPFLSFEDALVAEVHPQKEEVVLFQYSRWNGVEKKSRAFSEIKNVEVIHSYDKDCQSPAEAVEHAEQLLRGEVKHLFPDSDNFVRWAKTGIDRVRDLLSCLRPGDHLKYQLSSGYFSSALVAEVHSQKEEVVLFEYSEENGVEKKSAAFSEIKNAEVVHSYDKDCQSPTEAVERAEQLLREVKHSFRDSFYFVCWAKTGFDRVRDLSRLRPGDHLKYHLSSGYFSSALVAEVHSQKEEVVLFEYSSDWLMVGKKSLAFSEIKNAEVDHSYDILWQSPAKAVERAEQLLRGEVKHSFRNSADFVRWAKTGFDRVRDLLSRLRPGDHLKYSECHSQHALVAEVHPQKEEVVLFGYSHSNVLEKKSLAFSQIRDAEVVHSYDDDCQSPAKAVERAEQLLRGEVKHLFHDSNDFVHWAKTGFDRVRDVLSRLCPGDHLKYRLSSGYFSSDALVAEVHPQKEKVVLFEYSQENGVEKKSLAFSEIKYAEVFHPYDRYCPSPAEAVERAEQLLRGEVKHSFRDSFHFVCWAKTVFESVNDLSRVCPGDHLMYQHSFMYNELSKEHFRLFPMFKRHVLVAEVHPQKEEVVLFEYSRENGVEKKSLAFSEINNAEVIHSYDKDCLSPAKAVECAEQLLRGEVKYSFPDSDSFVRWAKTGIDRVRDLLSCLCPGDHLKYYLSRSEYLSALVAEVHPQKEEVVLFEYSQWIEVEKKSLAFSEITHAEVVHSYDEDCQSPAEAVERAEQLLRGEGKHSFRDSYEFVRWAKTGQRAWESSGNVHS